MDIGIWCCVLIPIGRHDNNIPIGIDRFYDHLLARWPKWSLSIRQLHACLAAQPSQCVLRCSWVDLSAVQLGNPVRTRLELTLDRRRRTSTFGAYQYRHAKLSVPTDRYQILCRSR
jgi:hypothetical protein